MRNTQSHPYQAEYGEILKVTLGVLITTGIVAAAVTCPNLLSLIPRQYRRRYSEKSFRQAFYRLDKKGWLVLHHASIGWRISLTQRGRKELLAYELGQKTIPRPHHWDQRWRLLIFDIPEQKRRLRDQVRSTLILLGFVRLQDSVWIFPYECQQILELLRTKYGVRHEALFLRVDSFDQDRWLRKHFHLS